MTTITPAICSLFFYTFVALLPWQPALATIPFEDAPSTPVSDQRVRLGFRLTALVPAETRPGENQPTKLRFVPQPERKHTLRARINRRNHFYLGAYHIETEPRHWDPQTQKYALRVHIYQRYGQHQELEERLGSLDVAGFLQAEDRRTYVLHGVTRKRFRNRLGHPVADVIVGFGQVKGRRPVVSRKGP